MRAVRAAGPVELDAEAGAAKLSLSAKLYSLESVAAAARVLEARARTRCEKAGARLEVTLLPRKAGDALAALAADFLDEALGQERRRDLLRTQEPVVKLIVTRALYSAMRKEAE